MGKKRQLKTSKELPTDPNEYTIKKEGEAEILLHGNDVFYNPTQVVNRDFSVAMLRTFVIKRKEEHAAFLAKKKNRTKGTPNGRAESSLIVDGCNPVSGEGSQNDDIATNKGHSESQVNQTSENNGKTATDGATTSQENKDEKQPTDQSDVNQGSTSVTAEDTPTVDKPITTQVGQEPAPLRVLEALAASGLRTLRYAREVDGIGSVIALDNDKVAVEACNRNIKLNGSTVASKVETHLTDCRIYMLTHEKQFDVVDLDPYGSPSIFLDSAVQAVADGGMILCTATDMAVLCGNNGEACYSKYGAYPARAKYCHEMALRILLACIESHANRYKRYIVPVLSLSVDFYIRVFVRVFTSANAVINSPLKLSYLYQCVGCDSFHLQPVARTINKNKSVKHAPAIGPIVPQDCSDCGKKFVMAGPIWTAPIHDPEWVSCTLTNISASKSRYPKYEMIHSILTSVSEELVDVPLSLNLHSICSTLKCTAPSTLIIKSAIINAGYRASGTHTDPVGIKTDAPMHVIWDIMRCWIKTQPVKKQPPEQPGSIILSKEPTLQANFARAQAAFSNAQVKKVPRFLPNPEHYWGPKLKAGRQITEKHASLLGPDFVKTVISQQKESDKGNGENGESPEAKKLKREQELES